MPSVILPLLMLSMRAICSASRMGWWSAIWTAANPMLDALCAGGDGGCEGYGVNVGAGAVVVVLSEPYAVEAQGFGEFGFAQGVGYDFVVGVGGWGVGEEEVAEFHGCCPSLDLTRRRRGILTQRREGAKTRRDFNAEARRRRGVYWVWCRFTPILTFPRQGGRELRLARC